MFKSVVLFCVLLLASGVALAGPVLPDTVTFDFEDSNKKLIAGTAALRVWGEVMLGGTTYDIGLKVGYAKTLPDPELPNSTLKLTDISNFLRGDTTWGSRSLSFFSEPGTPILFRDFISVTPVFIDNPATLNAAVPDTYGVSSIGWIMGDVFGTDEDKWVMITTGYPDAGPDYNPRNSPGNPAFGNPQSTLMDAKRRKFKYSEELQNRAFGIQSAKLGAGSVEVDGTINSVYFDNLTLNFSEYETGTTSFGTSGSDVPDNPFGGGNNPGTGVASGSGEIPEGSTVPLPGAVWLGMVMLAGLGLGRIIRRKTGR